MSEIERPRDVVGDNTAKLAMLCGWELDSDHDYGTYEEPCNEETGRWWKLPDNSFLVAFSALDMELMDIDPSEFDVPMFRPFSCWTCVHRVVDVVVSKGLEVKFLKELNQRRDARIDIPSYWRTAEKIVFLDVDDWAYSALKVLRDASE